MTHRVLFSPEAEAQLDALYRYIANAASPTVAKGYTGAIVEHCGRLEIFPDRGSPRDYLRPGMRTISFRRRVTIAYAVAADEVAIIGIFYGGQDIDTILSGDA